MLPRGQPISKKEEVVQKKEESTSTGKATLKDMEEQLNAGFYRKSENASLVPCPVGSHSIVPGSVGSTSRFQVPCGIDDKVLRHDNAKEVREQGLIRDVFIDTVLGWRRARVPEPVIQQRIDAFKVQSGNARSAVDCIRIFKGITDTIK